MWYKDSFAYSDPECYFLKMTFLKTLDDKKVFFFFFSFFFLFLVQSYMCEEMFWSVKKILTPSRASSCSRFQNFLDTIFFLSGVRPFPEL